MNSRLLDWMIGRWIVQSLKERRLEVEEWDVHTEFEMSIRHPEEYILGLRTGGERTVLSVYNHESTVWWRRGHKQIEKNAKECPVLTAWEKKDPQKKLSRNTQCNRPKRRSTTSGKSDEGRNPWSNSSLACNRTIHPNHSLGHSGEPSHGGGDTSPLPRGLGMRITWGCDYSRGLKWTCVVCLISCIPGIFHEKNMFWVAFGWKPHGVHLNPT